MNDSPAPIRRRVILHVEWLEPRCLLDGNPLLTSWIQANYGEPALVISQTDVAAGPSPVWPLGAPPGAMFAGGTATPTPASIRDISYSGTAVYVQAPGLASYVMGPWFLDAAQTQLFPNFPADQHETVRFSADPQPATVHTATPLGAMGLWVNGVSMFNMLDGYSWNNARQQDVFGPGGDGFWNRDANFAEQVTFDAGNAHSEETGEYHTHSNPAALRVQLGDNIAYTGSADLFPYDPSVETHRPTFTHALPFEENTTNLHHSPILGYADDGYPVYGPYGHSDPTNPNSPIELMTSSYRLRTITTRTALPGWAAKVLFGDNVSLDANGEYPLPSQDWGPPVSADHPLGEYVEDYEYVPGLGTLDQYNGRFTVTPEYPQGTYAYFVTVNASEQSVFPYVVGRQFYGRVNSGVLRGPVPEPTTTYFDVNEQQYVIQLYRDLLNRAPDPAGLAGWTQALYQGRLNRVQIAQGIESSVEYRTDEARAAYQALLGRAADPQGLFDAVRFLVAGGTLPLLEANLMGSAEYYLRRGGGSDAGFLVAAFHDALAVAPTAGQLQAGEDLLADGVSRTEIAALLLARVEAQAERVAGDYERFLRRVPDLAGWDAYTVALHAGFSDEAVLSLILGSAEYFALL